MPQPAPVSAATPSTRKPPIGVMIAVLLVVAALVLGYVVGLTKGQRESYAKGTADATAAAEKKVADSPSFVAQGETRSISGTVTAVNGDGFEIDARQVVRNPLARQAPTHRTVHLADGAKIMVLTPKDSATFQAEMNAYRASTGSDESGQTTAALPSRFAEKEIALTDLKVGMSVNISSDADITYADAISATSVGVTFAPEEPAQFDASSDLPSIAAPQENPAP